MKKSMIKVLSLCLLLSFTLSCSNDDDAPPVETGDRLYEANGSWDCTVSESCQDVYELDMKAGSRVSFTVGNITGDSVLRIAIHAPGNNLGGINLLTGTSEEVQCGGQNESYSASNLMLSQDGIYRFVVTRDWGLSAGTGGNYSVTVFSDTLFQFMEQTVDDVDSLASGSVCP